MWFAESITWIVLDDKNEVHGRTCLIETINKYTKSDIQLVRKDLEINDIMYYYEYFFENISELYSFDIFDDETLDNFLYQTSKFKVKLNINAYRKDPKWFCSYTKLIYYGFSGITLIDEEMHKKFVVNDFDINTEMVNYTILEEMKQSFTRFIYNNNNYIKVSKDFISTFEKNKFGKDEYDIIEKDLFNQVKNKYENCEDKEIHSSELENLILKNPNFEKLINTYIYEIITVDIFDSLYNQDELIINLDELIISIENTLNSLNFVNEVSINNTNALIEMLEEIIYSVYNEEKMNLEKNAFLKLITDIKSGKSIKMLDINIFLNNIKYLIALYGNQMSLFKETRSMIFKNIDLHIKETCIPQYIKWVELKEALKVCKYLRLYYNIIYKYSQKQVKNIHSIIYSKKGSQKNFYDEMQKCLEKTSTSYIKNIITNEVINPLKYEFTHLLESKISNRTEYYKDE